MQESLKSTLLDAGIDTDMVSRVLDSGYWLRGWVDPFSGKTWTSVSDFMYGNKGQSSNFETEKFISHLKGRSTFDPLPTFRRYTVRTVDEIRAVLSEPYRARLMNEGRLSFRGQTSEHTFKRHIPNPVRSDKDGREISVLPGVYRQSADAVYSFSKPYQEQRSFEWLLHKLEPNNTHVYSDSAHAYDIMRVEQHYATQTAGLDVSFDIGTPVFFSTHHFEKGVDGLAYYRRVPRGEHKGVIYCFCFRDPPVKAAEYLIKGFDLFKTYRPERVLRQRCGLPLIGDYERNIALTDLDCIIELDADFSDEAPVNAKWMFPGISEDAFYKQLLEIKDANSDRVPNLVEYKWARTT